MKTMYKKIVMRSIMLLMALGLVFGISSCSRDDDPSPNNSSGNKYKITLTLNGVDADDHVVFSLAGTNTNADSNVWKINGQTQAGQIGIGLNEDNFSGSTKTYVIESNFPIVSIASGFTVINYNPGAITGNLKIEKNGSEVVNQAVNLSANGAELIKTYNL